VIEDRGDYELVQDFAGRHVLYFKGRRSGFMPEYVDHPVKDMRTWEELCAWRMNPDDPARWADFDDRMAYAKACAGQGLMIFQNLVGGYMYLRSLVGPEGILYAFYDMPEVVHACMQQWLTLADAVIARYQQHVTLDVFYLAEDICYNHGLLCSPNTMKEFLLPYYQQLISNIRARQIDKNRHLYIQVDTDGDARAALPIYKEHIGLDVMTPFEVASNCDVVEIGKQHPDIALLGGIDKRELAKGPEAIDRMVDRIIPVMRARGGYIPTCDHGVPEEVSLENYMHYRKRCIELGG
jgi:uroporphyrinogen decarboxylase